MSATSDALAAQQRKAAMEDVGRAFKEASAAVRRLRGRDAHHPCDLSHAQYSVLFELLRRGELPAGELAAVAGVSPASMTEMLDRLADAGLVERSRSDRDRRVVVCRLTGGGRERCEAHRAKVEPLWTEALSAYSVEELAAAAAVLDSLRGLFDRLDELDGS
jgi:DNA-binding MarR family transcriptional regulator